MPNQNLELTAQNLSFVEEIGRHMPGGFFIYQAKPPETLIYANQACFSIFGCRNLEEFRELTGYTFRGMVHPKDYEAVSASIADQIRESEEKMDYTEYRIIRKDGSVRWVDDYGHYTETRDYGGVYYVFISDITPKRIALEQAMEKDREENRSLMAEVQSAAKLADFMASVSSILTNMPAMSFSKDAETGAYLACNQAFAEYAGRRTPRDVVGLTDHQIFDQTTADHFVRDDRKALEMDDAYIFFEDVPDATGKILRNLQTTKTKFRDEAGRLCLLGLCVDVTEMTRIKTAEAETHARQEALEARVMLQEQLLEQNSMITAMASDYRSVYHVNLDTDDAVCYRADPEDQDQHPVGVHFPYLASFTYYGETYVDPEYREGFLRFIDPDHIRDVLSRENIVSYRYLARRGGKEYYEMFRMAGVRHAGERDDHLVHAVGVGFTVIDEEMREAMARNRALREALTAAEEANKAKTSFLSNMSHEIRTPLNAIIGLDNLALRDETLSETTREYLTKINGSARHLLGLINDILDMSRIESGRMVLRREEFSFSGMLEQINTMVMSQCADKGLSFECRINGSVDDAYIGDDMKLKQVLVNILSNAIKFTEAPGSVTLSIERQSVYDGQSTLRFSVRDTGVGMDPDFLPKVFDSFTQEDSGRKNKYGSTGLGMAITRNLVELMNGNISVTSEKNVGTEFTVVITLRNCERAMETVGRINPRDLRVLVVDDDPVACEHALIVLEEAGVRTATALNGPAALEMLEVAHAKQEAFNLVLLDWKMPEMDGIQVAREIRSRYDTETTVIILTAYSWDEIMDEALHTGVDSFLAKPIFASNVLDEFIRIARRHSMSILREKQRANLQGRRILLAEDIQINAEIVMELIGSRGAQIDHAVNGRAAAELFAGSPPGTYDAILMDVRMPEMDGLEATQVIRAMDRPDARTIPIIAMTANAFDEDVQRSLQVGMNAHLSKPVEPEHLYQTLEELIWENEHGQKDS